MVAFDDVGWFPCIFYEAGAKGVCGLHTSEEVKMDTAVGLAQFFADAETQRADRVTLKERTLPTR